MVISHSLVDFLTNVFYSSVLTPLNRIRTSLHHKKISYLFESTTDKVTTAF